MHRFAFAVLAACLVAAPAFAEDAAGEKKLPARDQRLRELKKSAMDLTDVSATWLDAAPKSPFLLGLEPSQNYSAPLMLEAFRECVDHLYSLFKERFGSVYDPKTFERDRACLVYVFETRDRYLEITKSSVNASGHVDAKRGIFFLYKDSSQLYETIFREGVVQLLSEIARQKGRKDGDPLPPWLTEGAGTWFESFKRDVQGAFVLGQLSALFMPTARKLVADGKTWKIEDFLQLKPLEEPATAETMKEAHARRCQAWAFWTFLEKSEAGGRREKLDSLIAAELEGKGGLAAAKEQLGDLGKLNDEFVAFVKDLK